MCCITMGLNTEMIDLIKIIAASFKAVSAYIIPLMSVALSYILGRLESRMSLKRTSMMEQYTNLYLPYIQKLYAGFMWENTISDAPLETRSVFFDLLTQNIQYLDESSQGMIPEFYSAFLDLLEYDSGNEQYSYAPEQFEQCFWRITKSIIVEASQLSKKLRLPDITITVSAKLSQSGRM